jgi:hypothetical protein
MRPAIVAAGLLGLALGFGGGRLFPPPAPAGDDARSTPAPSVADRWDECFARLDALAVNVAQSATAIHAEPAATRVAVADEPSHRVEQRLDLIEAALSKIAAAGQARALPASDLPRRAKETSAIDRLYQLESADRSKRFTDHLGYTAERLYDRYGAPDAIERPESQNVANQFWVYLESQGDRGIYFALRDGVVEREWTFRRN